MKTECLKEKLEQAVGYAEKITSKNSSLPVLKCIYLEVQKGTLVIKATNIDLGIEIKIPVKTESEGVAAVPGNVLYNFLSSTKNDKSVILEEVGGNLKVSTPRYTTLIKCLPVDDFPTIPRVEGGETVTLNTLDLVKGFKSVWYSSSVSSMKPELSSVYVYPNQEGIVFAATDAFRLAEKKVKTKKVINFSPILIPFRNVGEIIRVFEGKNESVEVQIDKHQISFTLGDIYLTSRIVDGTFPDYKNLIPKEASTEVVILKQDLVDGLKVANIFSDKFNKVTMTIEPKKKVFELKTKNSDVGESANALAGSLSGDSIEISFNYKNITDAFQSLEADSLSLSLNGLNKPLAIRGVSDNSFVYIVMPMNK